jgi:citrate lyase beta subunit
MQNTIRLRRSILSVPANREKMIEKAFALDADVIMLDMEDSVPVDEKEEARKRVVHFLKTGDWKKRVRSCRINAMNTSFAYRDIVEVVEQAGEYIDTIVVPKVEDPAEIKAIDYFLSQIEMGMGLKNRIGLEACIETALGMLRVGDIALSSERMETLVFGIADYSASMTMLSRAVSGHGEKEDFYPGHRFHYPLSRMAMAAKAAGLAAIDAPYGDYKDAESLKRSSLMSAALGYDGKWAIHPDQIGIINEVYSPSEEDYLRSSRIIEAYEQAGQTGAGSLAIDGKMVDAASVRIARGILAQWDAINSRSQKT